MKLKELIPEKEDREFTSSIGHWQGDGTWATTSPFGGTGLIKIPVPPGPATKNIYLAYPKINLPKEKSINFIFYHAHDGSGPTWGGFWWQINDATHTIYPTTYAIDSSTDWWKITGSFNTPTDWDQLTANLFFNLYQDPDNAWDYYFDNFSLQALVETIKPQFLPILGVG